MLVTGIALKDFRSHQSLILPLNTKITLIIGSNASGKTTVIEGLFLLATGESFRAKKIAEVISFGKELARLKGVVVAGDDPKSKDDRTEIEVVVTNGLVQGKKTHSRLFSINNVSKRKKDAVRKFSAVVFRPEDMRLVEGSPSRRRGFIDSLLSQLFIDYERALTTYEQALLRKNKVLLAIKEKKQPASVVNYYNDLLLKNGEILQKFRSEFLAFCNEINSSENFSVEYLNSQISTERQQEYWQKEMIVGHTLIGPHKDDLAIFHEDKKIAELQKINTNKALLEISRYGSRGQQRLAVLWLKFCELAYVEKITGHKPLLLLDDILSELDEQNQKIVIDMMSKYQTVLTTIEPKFAEQLQGIYKEISVVEFN